MQGKLQILNLSHRPVYHLLPGEFLILGRGRNADIILENDTAVSRLHCKIFYSQKRFWAEDLGSRNCTVVNNRPIARRALASGDLIRIGRYHLKFTLEEREQAPIEDEQEGLARLKREDKLFGKIALELKLLSRSELNRALDIQSELTEEGPYIDLAEILLQENFLDLEQIKQVQSFRTDIPFHIPGYKLHELIGFGGMGRIYKGRQLSSNTLVAVKILSEIPGEEKLQLGQQFITEAKVIAKLNHPNIVAGLDFGFAGKYIYLVMEYIDGPSLSYYVKERGGRVLPDEALEIITQVAGALEYAYSQRLVHRDIKPENILLTAEGDVKLCDFGLVKEIGVVSEDERIFGTPAYMSPEQCLGRQDVDIRSDIYSLGVVFYRILFGRLPFSGSRQQIRQQHLKSPVQFPNEGRHFQKMELAKVIQRMMAKQTDFRYQTPSDLLDELKVAKERFVRGEIEHTQEIANSGETLIDATEIRRIPSPDETQAIFMPRQGWQRQKPNFSKVVLGWVNQQKEHLAKLDWANKLAFIKHLYTPKVIVVTAVTVAVLLLSLGMLSWWAGRQEQQQSAHKVQQAIANQRVLAAIERYQQHRSQFQQADEQQQLTEQLFAFLMQKARQAKNNQENLQSLMLLQEILKLFPEGKFHQQAQQLRQSIVAKQNQAEAEKKFWQLWNATSNLIDQQKWTEVSSNLQKLVKLAQNSEQQDAYQQLQKRLKEEKLREKLKSYRYYTEAELALAPEKISKPLPNQVKIEPLFLEQPHPLESQQQFFVVENPPYLYCFHSQDGKLAWSLYLPDIPNPEILYLKEFRSIDSSAQAEHILVCSRDSNSLLLLDRHGRKVWECHLPGNILSAPLCHDNYLYLACDNRYLYKVFLPQGKVSGGFLCNQVMDLAPKVDARNELLYIGSRQGNWCAFSLRTGKLVLRDYYQAGLEASPEPFDQEIVLIAQGKLTLYHTAQTTELRPELRKEFALQGKVLGQPLRWQQGIIYTTDQVTGVLAKEQGQWHLSSQALNHSGKLIDFKWQQQQLSWWLWHGQLFQATYSASKQNIAIEPLPQAMPLPGKGRWQSSGSHYLFHSEGNNPELSAFNDTWQPIWNKQWPRQIDHKLLFDSAQKLWLAKENGALGLVNLNFSQPAFHFTSGHPRQNIATFLYRIPHSNSSDKLLILRNPGASHLREVDGRLAARWKKDLSWGKQRLLGVDNYQDRLFFVTYQNRIRTFALANGKEVYAPFAISQEEFSTRAVLWRRFLLVGSNKGFLYLLRISSRPPYQIKAFRKYSLGHVPSQLHMISPKQVLIATKSGPLLSFSLVKQQANWRFPLTKALASQPTFNKNKIYLIDEENVLSALSLQGEQLWQHSLPAATYLPPVVLKNRLYLASRQGKLLALRQQDGKILWQTQLATPQLHSLLADSQRVYALADDGWLFVIHDSSPLE